MGIENMSDSEPKESAVPSIAQTVDEAKRELASMSADRRAQVKKRIELHRLGRGLKGAGSGTAYAEVSGLNPSPQDKRKLETAAKVMNVVSELNIPAEKVAHVAMETAGLGPKSLTETTSRGIPPLAQRQAERGVRELRGNPYTRVQSQRDITDAASRSESIRRTNSYEKLKQTPQQPTRGEKRPS